MQHPADVRLGLPWEDSEAVRGRIIDYLKGSNDIISIGSNRSNLLESLRAAYPGKVQSVEIAINGKYAPKACASVVSSESLPLRKDSFDGLVCNIFLDHLDKYNLVNEVKKVMKYGDGKAVLFLNHPQSGYKERLERALAENPEREDFKKYLSSLESPMETEEQVKDFFESRILIDKIDVLESESEDGKNVCYGAFLKNKAPLWNFITRNNF